MQKRISTITPRGLNTSMPDTSVPDGACEVLHNLRFQNGAWEPVGHFPLVEGGTFSIPVLDKDTIAFLYAHEMDGAVHFIVKAAEEVDEGNNVFYNINLYDCINGSATLIGTFSTITNLLDYEKVDIRVSSFGNVLIVSTKDTMSHYIFSDGKYNLFKMPEPASISEAVVGETPRKSYDKESDRDLFWWNIINADSGEHLLVDNINSSWWGEICYLVAYRMKDGTIISPSNLRILCSEGNEEEDDSPRVFFREVVDDQETKKYVSLRLAATPIADPVTKDTYAESVRLRTFIPELTITTSDVDSSLIDRVALYSTRINPILDYKKMQEANFRGRSGIPYYDFYADNKLPEQPFYLVDEAKIESLENGVWTIQLEYEKLKDLVTRPQMYEPVQVHSFVANSLYDYNHRMHYGGLTTTLYSHTPSVLRTHTTSASNILKGEEYVQFEDGHSVYSSSSFSNVGNQTASRWVVPYIVSYPDYRATTLSIVYTRNNNTFGMESISLQPAVANNFAYYIPPTGVFKYTSFISPDNGYSPLTKPIASPTFSELNRIQVSAVDNVFSLPFENSYAVGNRGSRVVAMNSVADALADSTFYGAYPLYIFTTDGIFALRAGSGQVLYAGTENINHDQIVNPATIAMNGMVVYACSEGLKALAERTAARISADIDTSIGAWRDWSKTQFAVNWRYGELLCRMANGELFVLNAAARAWSTRDSIEGSINGGYAGELVDGELEMYNIDGEMQDDIVAFSFTTRPLKLESVGFKKLEQMIARAGSNAPITWSVRVEGSNDCLSWRILKQVSTTTNQNIGLRHFSQSCRYYRVTISGEATFATISQIDFQLQDRYNKKLR
ncbi:MAG: hypothetical protein J6U49_07450 [Alistipes sp.]|nr:hypothetical protein [Alistipes sp.]